MKRLQAAADELSTRWKWAEAMADVDWSATARFGRIHPEPAEPTDAEKAEIEKLRNPPRRARQHGRRRVDRGAGRGGRRHRGVSNGFQY